MSDKEDFAVATGKLLFERATPRLKELLAARGVTRPEELSQKEAADVFRQAVMESASNFPEANTQALQHGLKNLTDPIFQKSLKKVRAEIDSAHDAFALASGVDAAIVLAGFGLPVAPFDKHQLRILGPLSNDMTEVSNMFSNYKTAFVGYSPCETPFYILITDCLRTLCQRVQTYPELIDVKRLFERAGTTPPNSQDAFRHGAVLFAREPGDQISSLMLHDPSPYAGSIQLNAGWDEGGVHEGTANDGFLPVPLKFLQAAIADPQIAMCIWEPVGYRALVH